MKLHAGGVGTIVVKVPLEMLEELRVAADEELATVSVLVRRELQRWYKLRLEERGVQEKAKRAKDIQMLRDRMATEKS